jgi:hypothetical protein
MEQTDLPFYPSLSRTNSEMSDVSSVPSEAGGSTSSQATEASDESDRVPTQEDLDNDNWRYLSDFFVTTKTPTKTRNVYTSAYSDFQVTEKSRLARRHMMPSRAISRGITCRKKVNSKH